MWRRESSGSFSFLYSLAAAAAAAAAVSVDIVVVTIAQKLRVQLGLLTLLCEELLHTWQERRYNHIYFHAYVRVPLN